MNSLLLEAENLIGQSKEAEATIVLMRALEANEEDHQARLMLARVLYGLGLRKFSGFQLQVLIDFFPENKRLKRLFDLITGKTLEQNGVEASSESNEAVKEKDKQEPRKAEDEDIEVEVEFDADFF